MTEQHRDWRDWFWRFILHVVTGALAVIVHYGVMAIGLNLDLQAVMASSIGFVAGAVTRFVTAYYKVFTPADAVIRTLPRFLLALGAQGLLNSLLLALLLGLNLPVWWAQVSATALLTLFNYLVYRLWVFR